MDETGYSVKRVPSDHDFLNMLRESHDGNNQSEATDNVDTELNPSTGPPSGRPTNTWREEQEPQGNPVSSVSTSSEEVIGGATTINAGNAAPARLHQLDESFLMRWQASQDANNDSTVRVSNTQATLQPQNNLSGLFIPPLKSDVDGGQDDLSFSGSSTADEEIGEFPPSRNTKVPFSSSYDDADNTLQDSRPLSHDGSSEKSVQGSNNSPGHIQSFRSKAEPIERPMQNSPTPHSRRHELPPKGPPRPTTVNSRSQSVAVEKPSLIHNRSRSVSFDKHGNMSPRAAAAIPEEGEDDSSLAAKISALAKGHQRRTSVTLGKLGQRQDSKRLTIDDILGGGKFESEAEANILKALEEQQQIKKSVSHRRLQSENTTILRGVPDSRSHDFSLEDDIAQQKTTEESRNIDDEESTTSQLSAIRQQSRPLLNDRGRKPKSGYHRHTMSIEERLEGLSLAMWQMEEKDDDEPGDKVPVAFSDGGSAEFTSQDPPPTLRSDRRETPPSPRARLDTAHSEFAIPAGNDNIDKIPEEMEEDSSSDDEDVPNPEPKDAFGSIAAAAGGYQTHGNMKNRFGDAAETLKDNWDVWLAFFRPRKHFLLMYLKRMLLYLFLPFVGTAAFLFYIIQNPPTGKSDEASVGDGASISWWLLFVVRQSITLSFALGMQVVVIDFLCVGTKIMLRLLGPTLTLLIVQAKGWPFVVLCWSILDFGLLFGRNKFAAHWGYFQPFIGLFNDNNPDGTVVDNDWNRRALLIGVTVSLFVSVKRFLVGLLLGRQTFHHYGEQLAAVMNKMLLVGAVASLAKRIYKTHSSMSMGLTEAAAILGQDMQTVRGLNFLLDDDDDDESDSASVSQKSLGSQKLIDPNKRSPLTGSLLPSEKAKLMRLVDQWEEPTRRSTRTDQNISISSILKFRNALTLINDHYPFSYAFGPADTRESCIEGSQELFSRLLLANSKMDTKTVQFETIAMVALEGDTVNQEKAKELIKVFRPDRDGCLSVLDFVRSVDNVYKEFRLLQASIDNSSQIDRAFENIANVVFYAIVVTIILSLLGFDPFSLFLSMSSVILAFAFMIGSASAKYFEGVLFILGRRPYGIGDIIHVSSVDHDITTTGAKGWRVQHVSLFETSFTWVATNESATVSNGSLASSRIINWARSPNPRFNIHYVVPIETNYETLELFKLAIEEYVKVRPREWLAFNAFRVDGVYADKGYMKIEVIVQHRDTWQNFAAVMDSRGNVNSFCLEVQKILGMQYRAPIVPLDLSGADVQDGVITLPEKQDDQESLDESNVSETEAKSDLFRSVAQNRHHIRLSGIR